MFRRGLTAAVAAMLLTLCLPVWSAEPAHVWLALEQANGVDLPSVVGVLTTETACKRYIAPFAALHRDPEMPADQSLSPLKMSCEKHEIYTDADVAKQQADHEAINRDAKAVQQGTMSMEEFHRRWAPRGD
jgi:hypothetical protein